MAKSKKKRKRNHIKKYPPLSKVDKSIYYIVLAGVVIVYLLTTIILLIDPSLLIRSKDVYAAEYNNTAFLVLPLIVYALYLVFICSVKKEPIFGNSKVNYFDTSRYIHVYPIFDKRYYNKERTKKFCIKTSIQFVIIPLFLVGLSIFALTGRYEIGNKGIIKYNMRNEIITQYIPEKIERYSVSTESHSSRYSGYYYSVDFKITTYDGDEYHFDNNSFKSISDMKKVDELLSDKPKTIENYYWLDRFSRNLNKEDAQILLEIFEKN